MLWFLASWINDSGTVSDEVDKTWGFCLEMEVNSWKMEGTFWVEYTPIPRPPSIFDHVTQQVYPQHLKTSLSRNKRSKRQSNHLTIVYNLKYQTSFGDNMMVTVIRDRSDEKPRKRIRTRKLATITSLWLERRKGAQGITKAKRRTHQLDGKTPGSHCGPKVRKKSAGPTVSHHIQSTIK